MPSIEEVLVSVWRQTLVDGANSVVVDGKIYLVKTTARRGLKQIDFRFDGHELRGLEQNPETARQLVDIAIEAHMLKFGIDRETAEYWIYGAMGG